MRVRGKGRAQHVIRTWRRLLALASVARVQTGKSFLGQAKDIVVLRRSGLRAGEYYDYRLFDDARFSPEQKREYTGYRFQWSAYRNVNDPGLVGRSDIPGSWQGMIDKLLFSWLMQTAAIPTPKVLALFDTAGLAAEGLTTVVTTGDLQQLMVVLASGFFVKPARAASGSGGYAVERVVADDVLLADGTRVKLSEFAQTVAAHQRVVIQDRLRPHPILAEAAGETVATIRVVVLRYLDRSVVHRTVLRIPAGRNMTDNFAGGKSGNLLGRVEPETGRIEAVYSGTGLDQVPVERHPDTDVQLVGLTLPDWAEAVGLTLRASRLFSHMPLQSWDLALTDRGPVMIEINDVSSQDVLQLCGPPGMLDRNLCAFLRERGFRWPYPYE